MRENQSLINKIFDQNVLIGELKTKEGISVITASVRLDFCDYETITWSFSTEKEEGDKVIAIIDNNHEYSCIGNGETGSVEPIWPTDGGAIGDGDIFWVDLGIYNSESLLEGVSFFYHCDPGNIDDGHVAFYVGDMVLVAEKVGKYSIIGFEDLKPRACDVIVLAGTGDDGKILRSIDSGQTWESLGQQYSQVLIRGIASLGDSKIVIAGTGGGGKILRSIDLGLIWTDLGQQFGETWIIDTIDLDSGICLAGTSPNGKILKSTDYGLTWTDKGQQFDQTTITELAYAHDGLCLATAQGLVGARDTAKIIRSIDYGDSWVVVWESPEIYNFELESIAYFENGICFAGCGFSGWNLRSTDYGLNWVKLDIPDVGAGYWEAPTYVESGICLVGHHQSYGNYEGHIWRSIDYGLNWTDLGQMFGESWIFELAYIGAGICLAGTGLSGKILRSEDKGLTWDDLGTQGNQDKITSLKRLGKVI